VFIIHIKKCKTLMMILFIVMIKFT